MKVSDVYAGSFMKAADLGGQARQVQISDITLEEFDEGKKMALHFIGRDQAMVLNKTNAAMIVASFGDDTEAWKGKTVELYPEKVGFQGKIVDALRVRIPVPPATAAPVAAAPPATAAADPAQPAPAATEGEPFNDDIPW